MKTLTYAPAAGICKAVIKRDSIYHITLDTMDGVYHVIAPAESIVECDSIQVDKHYCGTGTIIILDNGTRLFHAECFGPWGRYCSHCGAHMVEGYYVQEHLYACSDECAIALYGGDECAFNESIVLDDNGDIADDSPTYWTEWY